MGDETARQDQPSPASAFVHFGATRRRDKASPTFALFALSAVKNFVWFVSFVVQSP